MDIISEDKLRVLASRYHRNLIMIEKDYFLTLFLYCIRNEEGLYFKGGTALNKILLDYARLSEDLDFTITIPLIKAKKIIQKVVVENDNIFTILKFDKSVLNFKRYILSYKSYFNTNATINLDFNKRAKLLMEPERCKITNFYNLNFSVNTLNKDEMVAEKICALIYRNKPRDYYDVYQIIHKKIPIKMELVRKKSRLQNQEFSIKKVFDKTNKIYSHWEKDLSPLIQEGITFDEMITTLIKYFNYNRKKD